MDPLVSVCIPSYNNAKFIAETIRSVLGQTYTNLELIIVDDCSTDNTVDIIKGFDDRRITLYQNPENLGMHGNWNKSLSFANGEFIKLICGDDLIDPDCIALQVTTLTKDTNNEIVLVSVHRKLIDANGKESFGSFYKFPAGNYSGKKAVRSCVVFGTNLIGEPMAVLFRASVFKENKIVLGANNYTIDLDMYAQLMQYGKLVVLKECLASFRIYTESMSGSLGFKHYSQFKEFINQKYLTSEFGVNWFHRLVGKFITLNLTIARNIIISLSKS